MLLTVSSLKQIWCINIYDDSLMQRYSCGNSTRKKLGKNLKRLCFKGNLSKLNSWTKRTRRSSECRKCSKSNGSSSFKETLRSGRNVSLEVRTSFHVPPSPTQTWTTFFGRIHPPTPENPMIAVAPPAIKCSSTRTLYSQMRMKRRKLERKTTSIFD